MTMPLRAAELSGASDVSGVSGQAVPPVRAMRRGLPDDGIPVLTDLVRPETVPGATPTAAAHIEITQQLPAVNRASPTTSTDQAAAEEDERLDALSLRIQSRVLAGLTGRIDPIIEQRLRESLTGLLEQVLAEMTAELKATTQTIVRDAVAQAVAAELAELHKSKR